MKTSLNDFQKLPTASDWANLIRNIQIEDVEVNENSHYDPKKSPNFYDWMVNG
jgi:hypothetical protein